MDAIKREKVDWYIHRSTPGDEPELVTRLRSEAYENGLSSGSSLFLAPAVSQSAAGDGTTITTTAEGQEIAPDTILETDKHLVRLNPSLTLYFIISFCSTNMFYYVL